MQKPRFVYALSCARRSDVFSIRHNYFFKSLTIAISIAPEQSISAKNGLFTNLLFHLIEVTSFVEVCDR